MKICIKCNEEKPKRVFKGRYCNSCKSLRRKELYQQNKEHKRKKALENYYRHRDAYNYRCKKANKERYDDNSKKLWGIKNESGCIDCGVRDPRVLQFDHIYDNKSFGISRVKGYSWVRIEEELKKCVVRCANCHAIKTYIERGYGVYL